MLPLIVFDVIGMHTANAPTYKYRKLQLADLNASLYTQNALDQGTGNTVSISKKECGGPLPFAGGAN